jgi:hypothetical protein
MKKVIVVIIIMDMMAVILTNIKAMNHYANVWLELD